MYKNLKTVIVFFITIISSVTFGQNSSDTTALMQTIVSFYDAIEKGDVETRINLLSDDVILMPNHWTMMKGKESVAESFRRGASAVFKIKDKKIEQKEISANLAYTVNSYYYTYHNPGDSACWHKTKNVHIWKRDASGSWKLTVDIWNSDVPLNQFMEE